MEENEFFEPSFGEIVDLVKQYEESVKAQQQIFFEEENYEQIIEFYQANREYNKAIRVIDAATEQYPFSGFFFTKKAEILANQKHFVKAMAALDTAENLDPTDINIFLIRSDIYLWEGKHQEALDGVVYALTIASNNEDRAELYLEMADVFEDQEKYTEVIEALKNAMYQNPNSEEALNRMWFCTELLENYEDSIVFHEELIEQSPYSYLAWFNLAHAYAGVEMLEKSLEAFGFVIAIKEDFDPAYVCSGDVLYNMEKYNEAINFYMDATKLSRPNKEVYLKLAACYEKLGELGKSRSHLRKSIAVDPYFDEAFFRIAETYRAENKWSKAISYFERAVKLNKENTEYMVALADAYMNNGQGDEAVEIFEKLFQADTQAKQNWINLATAYFNVENFRKAFQVLNEAEAKFRNSADIFYIKAVFYHQAGNRHEALINLEKGLITNFDEHTMIFEMDEVLLHDQGILQVIEQYRD